MGDDRGSDPSCENSKQTFAVDLLEHNIEAAPLKSHLLSLYHSTIFDGFGLFHRRNALLRWFHLSFEFHCCKQLKCGLPKARPPSDVWRRRLFSQSGASTWPKRPSVTPEDRDGADRTSTNKANAIWFRYCALFSCKSEQPGDRCTFCWSMLESPSLVPLGHRGET